MQWDDDDDGSSPEEFAHEVNASSPNAGAASLAMVSEIVVLLFRNCAM